MDNAAIILEAVGYVGSALVIVSMLMSSVVKLRVINTVGSTISAIYALITHAYPLALMNMCLVVINIYNLSKLLKTEKPYDLIESNEQDAFWGYFQKHYKEDIEKYFPEKTIGKMDTAYMVCCDTAPAGILAGKEKEPGVLEIAVDYAAPAYRDCSVGKFLYSRLAERGIKKLICREASDGHVPYLNKMGFKIEKGIYVKYL